VSGDGKKDSVVRGPEFNHDRPKDHSKEEAEYRMPDSGIDYNAVALEELVRAVMRGNPANLRAVADGWQKLGSTLNERSGELDDRAQVLSQRWTGTAFDQYVAMVYDLTLSARQVAATALDLRDIAHADADLLEKAQRALLAGGVLAGGGPVGPDAGNGVQVSGAWGSAVVSGVDQGATVDVVVEPPGGA
jgi:uncharacterized protein YukE